MVRHGAPRVVLLFVERELSEPPHLLAEEICDELQHSRNAERLLQVGVVVAEARPDLPLGKRRLHENRNACGGIRAANRLSDIRTVQLGHRHVEHHQVGELGLAPSAVGLALDTIAFQPEQDRQSLCVVARVFDEQDELLHVGVVRHTLQAQVTSCDPFCASPRVTTTAASTEVDKRDALQ